jgi:hypothetical protein
MTIRARLLALAVALLPIAGCAAIPTQTQPKPINASAPRQGAVTAPAPDNDDDPLMLVRDFVDASANPNGDFAEAKAYLTEDAQKRWDVKVPPTIIEQVFSTVPTPQSPEAGDGSSQTIQLQGRRVGRLTRPDKAFVTEVNDLNTSVRVEKQPDGQWRISEPPNGVYMTTAGFNGFYQRVTLYFYNPDFTVLVPDARYVESTLVTEIPQRVMDLLVRGPSDSMRGAVSSALSPSAVLRKNVQEADDGALEVDLAEVGDLTPQARKHIVAQLVKSFAGVSSSRVRVLVEGVPILAEQVDWRQSDVQTGESLARPNADLHGMVVTDGRLVSLSDGTPVGGSAGTGAYDVQSAAQSLDGKGIAVVSEPGDGTARLRVGELGQELPQVDLPAKALTRPTWLLSGAQDQPSDEVWTVADGTNVVRVVRGTNGWRAGAVNASALTQLGSISELRLSRDGTRVAAVVANKLFVGAVVREADSVTIRVAMQLQPAALGNNVQSVDWLSQDVLVATTTQGSQAISKVYVDGLKMERYGTSNLTLPVVSVAAEQNRPVVVSDQSGLWTASDVGEVWRGVALTPEPRSIVFYPG